MPVVFLGHGSPMNTIQQNRNTAAWTRIGRDYPRPKAILSISAHWFTRGTAVTAMAQPQTIHDFGGFPQALFDFQYPAPGNPTLAARVRDLLAPVAVAMDQSWGLDHGTWSVLAHVYPHADIPVVQLSMDATQPAQFHYDLGRHLAPLRDEGVLIFGSGNVVHNLGVMRRDGAASYPWAQRFNDFARAALAQRNHQALIDFSVQGADARKSIPTPEHYLPLLYVLGASVGAAGTADAEAAVIENDGLEMGSISMLSARFGPLQEPVQPAVRPA